MSYNVHSCRGIDGHVNPERIAQVIEQFNPDLVALQELDVNRRSSKNIDQPLRIANHLRMHSHFQPAVAIEGEHYGIAILSRYPFDIVKAGHLPEYPKGHNISPGTPLIGPLFEPREVIWVSVTIHNTKINFLNTHLSLRPKERYQQVAHLLSDQWLGKNERQQTATILCGDFNSGRQSRIFKLMSQHFKEVKTNIMDKQKRNTFLSFFPFFEIDHIFFKGQQLSIKNVKIPKNPLIRVASDHLPLITEFNLKQDN